MRKYLNRLTPPHFLLIGAGILVLILIVVSVLPFPRGIDENHNGASVHFAVDDYLLFQPGDCVQVRWDVEGISSLYVDGRGRSGHNEETVCQELYIPRLLINFTDGSSEEYEIPLSYITLSLPTWAVLLVAMMMVFAAVYMLLTARFGERVRPVLNPVWRIARRAILAIILLAVSLGVLEIGIRAYFENYGTEQDRMRYLYSAEEIRRQSNALQAMPLIHYLPQFDELNPLGYRGESFSVPKPDGVFRIATLGGSTTYGTGLPAHESYPAQLQQILRGDYGYTNVEVVNAGVPSWNTWHSLANFAFRVLEVEPDLIIIYHAVNDSYPRVMPSECYSGIEPYLGISPNISAVKSSGIDLGPSVLYRFVAINQGWMLDPTGHASGITSQFERWRCSPVTEDLVETINANPPVYFERNLRSIIGMAQAHDMDVMLVNWVYYDLEGEWQVQAVSEHNAITGELAAELGLPFYDFFAEFPVDAALWVEDDWQHMKANGTRIQAELFAQFIVEEGLIR